MTQGQTAIITILFATMAMFIWGRWRYDMIAGSALLVCVYIGLIKATDAFMGFGNPAVITVACVLVLSHGLQNSGAVDALMQRVLPSNAGPMLSIAILTCLGALLSGFMNNVGALTLLMPIAIQIASKQNLPPGRILMPIAFGSILGGTMTLIGTPPNLIVSGFRAEAGFGNFGMFDFTPVGATVAAVGVLFIVLVGWRLVPARKQQDTSSFETGTYLTEVRIKKDSMVVGKTLFEVEQILEETDAQVIGLVRNDLRIIAPNLRRTLNTGDVLIIEIEPSALTDALSKLDLHLEENVPSESSEEDEKNEDDNESGIEEPEPEEKKKRSEETVIQEFVAMPNSGLINRSASDVEIRTRYGINLLAISHQGRRTIKRLRTTPILAGDVLLMQGPQEALFEFASNFSCVPLAQRKIRIPVKGQAIQAAIIMVAAILATTTGLMSTSVAFATGVVVMMVMRIVSPRSIYTAIDWPVIILLGAMLPVAGAVSDTGAADVIARFLIVTLAKGHPVISLAVIMIVTMILTDFMNNAATAAVMCPIALSTAGFLGVNMDTFLMAVAIGASCAFLTPIGHQNNTLIMGPGGFRFGDYWRLGLPTDIIVISVSLPVLLHFWPL